MTIEDPFREELAALALSRRPGVGAAAFLALLRRHGSPSAALAAHAVPAAHRRKSTTDEGLALAARWLKDGGRLLVQGGQDYPEQLFALGEPPPVLFLRGEPAWLVAPSVALVGGRAAGEGALEAARSLGAYCARLGLVVVSGGARGVDGAALEGVLDAGGAGVVVLGCGVDVVYPPEHRDLFERCAARGALVSELLPGAPPRRSFFVTRNRILAALAEATLLVWGDEGSGALTTVRWAAKMGRRCAALGQAGGQASRAQAEGLLAGAEGLDGELDAQAWLGALAPR